MYELEVGGGCGVGRWDGGCWCLILILFLVVCCMDVYIRCMFGYDLDFIIYILIIPKLIKPLDVCLDLKNSKQIICFSSSAPRDLFQIFCFGFRNNYSRKRFEAP